MSLLFITKDRIDAKFSLQDGLIKQKYSHKAMECHSEDPCCVNQFLAFKADFLSVELSERAEILLFLRENIAYS